MFLQTLIGLNQIAPIADYQYTGFGSYLFDDFKLLHDVLNISSMVSLENDVTQFKRAKFNLPYSCIEIKNIECTEYISELILEDQSKNIFWLDYVEPSKLGQQLADYATLLQRLNPYDIVRITLNANPSSLGESPSDPDNLHQVRFDKLKKRIQDQYFPSDASPDQVVKSEYPLLLLRILKTISMDILKGEPPYEINYLFPLFSSVYADGQQMVTFTGIVLNSPDQADQVRSALANYPHNSFDWDKPSQINIPALSFKEISELNKMLPSDDARKLILDAFSFIFPKSDSQSVDSYISYYKFYPNYHKINF